MNTNRISIEPTRVSSSVAPEDLRRGDFVAVLNEVVELPSYLWEDAFTNSAERLVRVQLWASGGGDVLKIKAICLPFIFVKSARGGPQTVDVRRVQLVRLSKRYAKTVWQARKSLRRVNE